MSWMTDLKQAAATRQADSTDAGTQVATNVSNLQSQLQRLHDFLSDMAEQLNVVDPYVAHDYDVLGYAELNDLRQTRYAARAEMDGELIAKVVFEFVCKGESPVQFFVGTKDECNTAKDRLLEHGLHIRWKDDADWRYVFSVQADVPVAFEFEPHPSELAIKLKGKNFQRLGVTTYSFEPEKLTDALLEEFGKRIVNQPNNFDDLSGYRVSNNMRKQFQEAIAARQVERQEELTEPPDPKAKKPNRLAKLFRRGEGEPLEPPPVAKKEPVKPAPAKTPPVEKKSSVRSAAKPKTAGFKKYAWMVTGTGDDGETTSELVSRLGPGVEYHAGINNLVSRGAHFRMLEDSGRVLFSGYIVGECTGREPLDEFGRDRGCSAIEYERKGNWVAL